MIFLVKLFSLPGILGTLASENIRSPANWKRQQNREEYINSGMKPSLFSMFFVLECIYQERLVMLP